MKIDGFLLGSCSCSSPSIHGSFPCSGVTKMSPNSGPGAALAAVTSRCFPQVLSRPWKNFLVALMSHLGAISSRFYDILAFLMERGTAGLCRLCSHIWEGGREAGGADPSFASILLLPGSFKGPRSRDDPAGARSTSLEEAIPEVQLPEVS